MFKITAFWYVTPYNLAEKNKQGKLPPSSTYIWKMDTACFCEKFAGIYQVT
jgi:hypothetical protein